MYRQTCFLFTLIVGILSQSCDYVKYIPVKYGRYLTSHKGKVFLSECISDKSMSTRAIEAVSDIFIECQSSKLPELRRNFVNNMTHLEYVTVKACNSIAIENNNISHIPRGIFQDLPKLNSIDLNSNNITTVAEEAFADLPALKYIHLDNNNIKHISRNWFTNTFNIVDFNISRNKIEEVPPMMFRGWSKAQWFDLSRNLISVIHKEAFANVSQKIFALSFHHNYLKELDGDSLPVGSLIYELRLDFNLFNYLPENFLRSISCRNIAIVGNPFKCSCLIRIYEVLTETRTWEDCEGYCNPKCNMAAVPVCASLPAAPEYCIETVDQGVTDRITSYMKEKLGYSSLHHWASHCESLIFFS